MTYHFFRLLRRADGLAVDNIATDAGQLEAISALTDGTGTLMECAGASCLLWHDAVLAAKSGPRTWRQPGPINSSASSHGKAGKRRHDAAAYVDQDFQLLTAPDAKRLARGINASVGAYPPFPSLGLLDPRLDTMDWNELQRSNRSPVTTMAQRLTNEAGRRQLRDLSAFFRRGPFFIGPVEAVGQRSEDSFEGRLLLAAPTCGGATIDHPPPPYASRSFSR